MRLFLLLLWGLLITFEGLRVSVSVCSCVYVCVCVCVHVYVYVHVCVQGGEVSQKGDGVEERKCLKAFHFAYYNCNLTIFLQALDLYALPCF